MANQDEVTPVKRGRGRPRKTPTTETQSASASTESEAPVKRGRGRPRKNPEPVAQAAEQPKRGRGRPRKEPATNTPAPVVAEEAPKKAPGRPRKQPLFGGATLSPEPVAPAAPVLTAAAGAREPRADAKRGRGRPAKQANPRKDGGSIFDFSLDWEDDDMPVPQFRPMSETRPAPKAAEPAKQPARFTVSVDDEEAPRTEDRGGRNRRRRGRDRREEPVTAADAYTQTPPAPRRTEAEKPTQPRGRGRQAQERPAPAAAAAPAAPAPQPKPVPVKTRATAFIPSDAPQVVLRDGVPTLVRDGQAFPPIFFFGSAPDEQRLQNVLDQIKLASEAGVHLYSLFCELEVDLDAVDDSVGFAAFLLKKVTEVDPQAQVLFRLVFAAPAGWEQKYPRAKFLLEAGGLGEPSVCDDEFWGVAKACLTDFIRQVRMLPDADRILGLHLERGEWFFADGWGYDTSRAAQNAFQEWTRTRYGNDPVALRASWFDGQAQFDTITVPEFSGEIRAGEEFVRTGRKARRWVDYHLFLSDATYDRISDLAHEAKVASDGYFLVGVSYGYTFEWGHPANGHMALGKLLRNPEVDFIAGPPSYKNREPGGSCAFPTAIDSFALNSKLFLSEEDFKTPISGREEPDDFNPVMKTPQALETVHWRGLGAALAHRSGVCWMDLWGNGWLKTHGIWDRGAAAFKALGLRMAAAPTDPDVAVFIDERSLAYLVDQRAFELLVKNVREAILRSGLSCGFYLISDLAHREHFPDTKLNIFLNAWDVRPEVRDAIKNRLQKDGKVLFWLYAAGLFDSGRDAMERIREITGIAIKRQPFASRSGTTLVHRKHPLCEALPESALANGSALEPSYFAIPEEGMVLAEYTATGLPSFVLRRFTEEEGQGAWSSVFLGEPVVTPAFFRALGQLAGCHVWGYQEDVIHIQAPFLTVHCRGTGNRTIALPDKFRAYNLQTGEWMPGDGTQVRFQATDGSTHTFLVGLQTEIEALLKRDPSDILRVETVPDRPENTLRLDELMFDVPMMKLDDWVEESWSEEIADDLIFRPSQLDELESFDTGEPSEGSSSPRNQDGGRRRGRRRRRREGGNERPERGSTSSDFDISEMNVVFRKRE